MELFVERLLAGVTNGSIFALLALALVMVYRSTGTLNFAQGEFALFSAFFAWWLVGTGLPVWAAVIAGMLAGFLLCAAAERGLIRPVQKKSELATLIVALGLFSGLNAAVALIWGTDTKVMPSIVPNGLDDYFELFGARVYGDTVVTWVALAVVTLLMTVLFTKTELGLHMRAVADNAESAALTGVNTSRILMLGWGLAGAIGALAGSLATPLAPEQLSVTTMFPIFIGACAAALLGGLDSLAGAVIGGLIIGVVEAMVTGYVPLVGGAMQQTTAMVMIVLILVVRPNGLFGSKELERV
ncbi:branched-chain amino acid ABC transporter permease [Nocardioides carbamazepini]|uniref:branched-chain amino acid ABC transporter permease n=1 Tax=Nocardioides carbamazepini TaxID=2854259 RepID=UPI002149BDA2|nr:branched-chain amino acid ABC transporter permease [Nocardioides carbamazepini]MCR1781275.1 branched-chain amino acid ABC transporter permease [Nocardioides carbamazepini]